MDSKKPLYKSTPFWIVVLLLLYSALGFFAIPYFAKNTSKKLILEKFNSTLTFDKFSFNPFTFATTATTVKLTDNDSTLWFSADKIEVDLNLWSSVLHNVSIEELIITNPYYKVVTENKNNTISVKYPKIIQTKEIQEYEEEFILDVNSIVITKGTIQYNDQSGEKQFDINLKELDFNHQLFTTKDSNSHFDLSVKTENNDETLLSGNFNFAQLTLDAKWQLKNWTTTTIFTFIGNESNQLFGFDNQSGLINAVGNISYQALKDKKSLISINEFNLTNFRNTHNSNQQFNLASTSIRTGTVDLLNQKIILEEVKTDGGLVDIDFDEKNTLVWPDLVSTNQVKKENNSTQKPWSFSIKKLSNTNSSLLINNTSKKDHLKNTINLQTVTINNINSEANQTMTVNADIVLDNTGKLNLQSEIIIEPLTIESLVKAEQIDLSQYSAWIPPHIKLSINKGQLSFQQQINYNNSLKSKGSLVVNNLVLFDNNKAPFLQLEQLNLEQLLLDSATKSIKLNKISLDKAQGLLMLSADKELNLSKLIDNQATNQESKNTGEDWKIEIEQIEFIDAKTTFIDKSIKPEYHTELSRLNGNVKGLSSSNLSKAKVKLSGVLDSYGKITVNGKINPLSDKAYTDLSIDINNLDLQNFNSYSSRYLGFPINRGKADFNLKYKLNQSILKGVNNLTFKQLKFGQKTTSKDAVNLPLKLAFTLLTDSKGIMKINMPVNGNIDDPEFSYGGLVFKAFFKLITGIVASPFKLLGKLIPGGTDLDLSGVQFLAGSAQLQTGEEEKFKAIQQILIQKPKLNLELTAITNTENDSLALRIKKLLQQTNLVTSPDFSDESQITTIKAFYQSQNNAKSWQQLTHESTNDRIAKANVVAEKAWNKLIEKQDITNELIQLSKQRALFVQSQLIEKYSVNQDKIFLKSNKNSQESPPQVKFGIAQ